MFHPLLQISPPPPRLEQLRHLQGSLEALSSALTRIGQEKQRDNYTTPILKKSQELQLSAQTMIKQGKLTQAQQQLNLAMNVTKTAIATLRNQETLVRSLDFASLQAEYVYEHQRYKGYCELVDLLIQNRPNQHSIQLRQQAKIIDNAAAQHASQQRFAEALKAQEQSNKMMVQAMRRSGVYVQG